MTDSHFLRRLKLPVSADEAYAWHERPGAFERLAPPWDVVEVVERHGSIHPGDRIVVRLWIAGLPIHWVAEHHGCEPGRQFCDRELAGPFAVWEHVHRFLPQGERCVLEDDITFRLPGGPLGSLLGGGHARHTLERMFAYRHRVTQDDMQAHAKYAGQPPQSVAITGATGLVGSQLVPFLTTGGHRAISLTRSKSSSRAPTAGETAAWDPSTGEISAAGPLDAVIHLAGESIAAGRWNARRKQAIRDSRVGPTRRLSEQLARLTVKPRVLICASAIGYYGDRGDKTLTEQSPAGSGFLPEVCREWEEATRPAAEAGIRVVNLRLGVILSPKGGALASMLGPFSFGVGGVIGSGRQYWSWIALDDVIGAIHHAIFADNLSGPVNVTAPTPVTNREFTKTLGQVLRRPTIFPLPAFAARIILGEMADELLLASARVMPAKLTKTGYSFRFSQLEAALRHVLGQNQK
jgi:uncharacterized protein (TIGR01777 family)